PVARAVEQCRALWTGKRPATAGGDPAAELRRLVWQPLEKHLDGVKIVLVAPDGPLARVPLPALPGSKPGTYLLEERPLAVVPIPQLRPELLAERPQATQAPSLLLVGAVDYGAAPGKTADAAAAAAPARSGPKGALLHFGPLAATRGELEAVRQTF